MTRRPPPPPPGDDPGQQERDIRVTNLDPMRPFPGWGWVLALVVAVLVGWWLL